MSAGHVTYSHKVYNLIGGKFTELGGHIGRFDDKGVYLMIKVLVRSLGMSSSVPVEPLIAVIGATGTGKSQLAVDLATRFNGEIINGDAMQLYKGLPIITNQIPTEERKGIPHHLLGCIGFDQEPWHVSHFKRECLRTIKEIRGRGKLPVLVGGTHYYTQAVLFKEAILDRDGEGDEESGNADRERMVTDGNSEISKIATPQSEKFPILNASPEVILQKLREVDPVMASRWHPNDTRRIYRSLEIYLQTGRPASEIYQEQQRLKDAASILDNHSLHDLSYVENHATTRSSPASVGPSHLRFPTLLFWVHTEDGELTRRLSQRVDNMAEQGLVAEAESLFNYLNQKHAQGVEIDRTRGVWVSIGFKELEPYFQALLSSASTSAAAAANGAGSVDIVSDVASNITILSQLHKVRDAALLSPADKMDKRPVMECANRRARYTAAIRYRLDRRL
ncbi:tRNA isopentenyltransferase [Histoplasma capsulatum H143]|uniref:tRNA isopentenyltransferase n=1 Tax=Ajellomyces capsulatus (strain H143) TaxID=544712 RepID=C6HGS0_AJECH|nr:tRNA isopentenyltransferase [Histoplasma capsulatum H143]